MNTFFSSDAATDSAVGPTEEKRLAEQAQAQAEEDRRRAEEQWLAEQSQAQQAQRRAAAHVKALVDVRLQALDRLKLMSVYLAQNAWRQRHADPIAPHCLGFVFVHADPLRPGMWVVSAGWRLWPEEPAVRSLPHLLNRLNTQWAYGASGDGFDIRAELADGCDAQPDDADVYYAGLGVLSLDTPAGAWEQVRARARQAADIPAEIRIVLTDKTVMMAQRLGSDGFDEFRVVSTEPLEYGFRRPHYRHETADRARLSADERHGEVLRWATELSDTLCQADSHRLRAQHDVAPHRERRS